RWKCSSRRSSRSGDMPATNVGVSAVEVCAPAGRAAPASSMPSDTPARIFVVRVRSIMTVLPGGCAVTGFGGVSVISSRSGADITTGTLPMDTRRRQDHSAQLNPALRILDLLDAPAEFSRRHAPLAPRYFDPEAAH